MSKQPMGFVTSSSLLKTSIDESNLKVGDTFSILKRGEQVIAGSGTVASVNNNLSQITVSNIAGFNQDPNESYDIRRNIETASSSGVNIKQGNNILSYVCAIDYDGKISVGIEMQKSKIVLFTIFNHLERMKIENL